MNYAQIKFFLKNDGKFRELFSEYSSEIDSYLNGCSSCWMNLCKKISSQKEKLESFLANHKGYIFKVINCDIEECEKKLKNLPVGAKVEAMSRFENQLTIILRIFI